MTAHDLQLPLPVDELRSLLQRSGVRHASVFGSYARGQATPDSDLDLLVELQPGMTYLDLGGAQYELAETYGVKADITTKLHPLFEPHIKPSLVSIL